MSNLPGKFSPLFSRHSAGGPYTIAGIDECPGDVWFVDSTHANATNDTRHGYTPDMPLATLAYAFSSDLVTSGDVVYLMPGHAETIAAAGGITMDIAGVKVIGLGQGAARPTFTWSTAASTWLITVASIHVENVVGLGTAGVDVTQGILVTGADCTLVDVEIREPGATAQFVDCVTFHTGAARGLVKGYKFAGAAGDAGQSGLQVTAAVDGCRFEDIWITGTFAAGNFETTAANTNMLLKDIYCTQAHATQDGGVVLNAGTTGVVINPVVKSATNDADGFNLAIVAAGAAVFNPLVVNLAGERGGAWGTASAAA